MSDCTTCVHCRIYGDDEYLKCEKDNQKMRIPDYCNDYEKRDDGLVAVRVWDWRYLTQDLIGGDR